MKDLNELLDKIEENRARHYESSKETDGSDVDRCPACKSADIEQGSAGHCICNDCGEMWM